MTNIPPKHRVALIGAGRIAAVHLRYARGVRDARVVAVCDVDRARADELAKNHQVPAAFTDVDEMMRATEPNIVHVVTPPATHAALAIAAMERGANVLVEKPMAMTVDECDRMIEVARRNGRRICVDHNRLFDPVVRRARALVASGVAGDIVSVEAHQGVNPVELGGGTNGQRHWSIADPFAPLYNLAPHPLYLAHELTGPVLRSLVIGRPAIGDASLVGEIRLLLEGERCTGYVAFSMATQPYLNHLNLFGTKATIRVNLNTMTVVVERVRRLPKLVSKTLINLEPAAQLVAATISNTIAVATRRMKLYPGIGETIRRFYASLAAGEPPPVDVASGRAVVELLGTIREQLARDFAPQATAADGETFSNGEARAWIS
jgi:predicted dehydrogenase